MGKKAVGKKAFDEKLARLDAIRKDPAGPEAAAGLRAALRDQGYLVGKAAAIAAEAGLAELIPDLLTAFDRLFEKPLKTDPQCWGKNGIARALKDLGHQESGPFVRGAVHVQKEPVWGGHEDTAATLRGTCLMALVGCRDLTDLQVLGYLGDGLADPKKPVRMDAVRAIGQMGREEGALLLRLKALLGDQEPEVTGACLAVMMGLQAPGAVEFAAHFLKAEDPDVRAEAAAALGESRDPAAVAVLRRTWETERDAEFRRTLLAAIGIARVEEAIEFLIGLIASPDAEAALAALAPNRFSQEIRGRVRQAVERTNSATLGRVFAERFPETD